MEESTAVPIDVESSMSLDTVSAQTTEGISMNTQTGILNSNGLNSSVSDHSQQPSSTLVNGSASSNVVPSPMTTPPNTQVPSLNSNTQVPPLDSVKFRGLLNVCFPFLFAENEISISIIECEFSFF